MQLKRIIFPFRQQGTLVQVEYKGRAYLNVDFPASTLVNSPLLQILRNLGIQNLKSEQKVSLRHW